MKLRLTVLLLLTALSATARADIVYDIQTYVHPCIFSCDPEALHYSFTTPNFLKVDTTIPGADLTTIVASSTCGSPTSVTLLGPFTTEPALRETFMCIASLDVQIVGFAGPFDHTGIYSYDAPLATIVTISGTPASAVPEPSSLLLLGSGLVGLGGMIRRKQRG